MTNSKRIGVAIVGTGFGVLTHVPGYRACEEVEVLALVGRQPEKTRRLADDLNIPYATTNLDDILDLPGLDLVSIATPHKNHARESIKALEAGKHVVVEKPIALNSTEAEMMVAAAERSGLINVVNTELRFSPTRQRMKALIDEGFLGRLYHLSATVYHDFRSRPGGSWRDSQEAGVIRGLGSHLVDLVYWMFGEIETVLGGSTETLVPEKVDQDGTRHPIHADDFAAFNVRLAGGAIGAFLLSTVATYPRPASPFEPSYTRIEAFGERGSLLLDLNERLYGAQTGQREWTDFTQPEPILNNETIRPRVWDLSFVHLARAVTTAIRDGGKASVAATFQDGLAVTRVLDAALQLHRFNHQVPPTTPVALTHLSSAGGSSGQHPPGSFTP